MCLVCPELLQLATLSYCSVKCDSIPCNKCYHETKMVDSGPEKPVGQHAGSCLAVADKVIQLLHVLQRLKPHFHPVQQPAHRAAMR